MSKDIIFESTYAAIDKFIEGKELIDLVRLHLYICGSDALNRPPTEMEKEFIGEFFTHDGWAKHIQQRKDPNQYIIPLMDFDLPTIQGILAFEINKLTLAKLQKRDTYLESVKRDKKKLKQELTEALDNSYHDDIFDKIDGFSNVYDVLINHKLVEDRRN